MAIERWGSLSVADHNDVRSLIANVLLYDRLVLPMCTAGDDRDERAYWIEKGWDPDAQRTRREQLGDLAIECAWDAARRSAYVDRYQAAAQLNDEVSGEMVTRWLLTENPEYPLPPGVNHADIFVAYNSELSAQAELPRSLVDPATLGPDARVAMLIAHELHLPDIADPEVALREAIGLASEIEFRRKREDLYDFQMTCIARGMAARAVVAELRDRNRELREYMEKQKIPVRNKTAFMLAQTLVSGLAASFLHPMGAIGGLLSIWQFTKFDAATSPQVPNRLAPVAAFHDIEINMGLILGR